jgi:tetrapyrrole methylase family protein/MazG family protein
MKMSFSDLPKILEVLKIADESQLILISALVLSSKYYPTFAPDQQVLIFDVLPDNTLQKLVSLLRKIYSENNDCQILNKTTRGSWEIRKSKIKDIDQIKNRSVIFIPPALTSSSLEAFEELIAHLRSPQGCPWDREQTHQTLRSNLLEESYEVIKTLDENDISGLREELGDLLLQIVLHSQISNEAGEFNLSQVIHGIHSKLVYRHPHVFGDANVGNAEGVIRNWEMLKSAERDENGKGEGQSILSGVPTAMPALSLAQEYQKRAARVGFDWPELKPVLDKVYEELEEVKEAKTQLRKEEELGDLLFAVVNLIRWYKVDAESALRKMDGRFLKRFKYIEDKVRKQGQKLQEMKLDEMDALWEEAKTIGL